MRSFTLLLFLLLMSGLISAQAKPTPINTDTITKDSALAVKDLHAILQLPTTYKIVSCEIIFSAKSEIFKWEMVGDRPIASSSQYVAFVQRARAGDRMAFSATVINKAGNEIRLAPKAFVFR